MTHTAFTAGIPHLGLWETQNTLCVKRVRPRSVFFCPDKLLLMLLCNAQMCYGLLNGCLKQHPVDINFYLFVFSSKLPNQGGIYETSSHDWVSWSRQRESRGSVSSWRTLHSAAQHHEPTPLWLYLVMQMVLHLLFQVLWSASTSQGKGMEFVWWCSQRKKKKKKTHFRNIITLHRLLNSPLSLMGKEMLPLVR